MGRLWKSASRMKAVYCSLFLVAPFCISSSVIGAVPALMNYQGKLTDSSGILVPDGAYGMRFSLYDSPTGATALWTEAREGDSAVPAANGLFNVLLGELTPIALPFDEAYWLGIEVRPAGSSSWESLSPRQRIASGAYAFRADSVTAGSITADSLADGAVDLSKLDTSTIPGLDGEGNAVNRIPSVSGVSPAAKSPGYTPFTATITGLGFQSVSRAKIGSLALENEAIVSSSLMTALVPPGLGAGTYDVAVSNVDLAWGTGAALFTVLTATPTNTPTATPTATPTFTATPSPTVTPTSTPVYLSCKAIRDAGQSTGDGLYTIDPDGTGGAAPFQAYCDMSTDGGGWTLVSRIVNDLGHRNTGAIGTLTSPTQAASAKLSDTVINQISTELYRFTCRTYTDYFDSTQRPFIANGDFANAITRSQGSYGSGSWCEATTGGGRLGLYSYPNCNDILMYASTGLSGCSSPPADSWGGTGTVYAR